jgi:hypothetical protein
MDALDVGTKVQLDDGRTGIVIYIESVPGTDDYETEVKIRRVGSYFVRQSTLKII